MEGLHVPEMHKNLKLVALQHVVIKLTEIDVSTLENIILKYGE